MRQVPSGSGVPGKNFNRSAVVGEEERSPERAEASCVIRGWWLHKCAFSFAYLRSPCISYSCKVSNCLHHFAKAAVTKNHRLGGLDHRNCCLSSAGWKSKVKVWTGLVLSKDCDVRRSLRLADGSPRVHMLFCPHSSCVQISSSYKDTGHIGLGSTLMTSMDMNLSKLQEIVRARGAWRALVHGVTKSQT